MLHFYNNLLKLWDPILWDGSQNSLKDVWVVIFDMGITMGLIGVDWYLNGME